MSLHGLCSLRPCVGLLVALSATISILVCRMKSGRSPQMVRTMRAGALVIFMAADHSKVGNGIHPCPVPHTGLSLCRLAVMLLCDVPRWSLKVLLPQKNQFEGRRLQTASFARRSVQVRTAVQTIGFQPVTRLPMFFVGSASLPVHCCRLSLCKFERTHEQGLQDKVQLKNSRFCGRMRDGDILGRTECWHKAAYAEQSGGLAAGSPRCDLDPHTDDTAGLLQWLRGQRQHKKFDWKPAGSAWRRTEGTSPRTNCWEPSVCECKRTALVSRAG